MTKNKTRHRTRMSGKEASHAFWDTNSWVRMMVINWIGNDTNCFLVHLVVEGLSKRLQGSPFLVSPILIKTIYLSSFYRSLWYKRAGSIAFAFSCKIWHQGKNIVARSRCYEIACRNNDGM